MMIKIMHAKKAESTWKDKLELAAAVAAMADAAAAAAEGEPMLAGRGNLRNF